MRTILNPKHDAHNPPGEVENGAVIPCYEAPPRLAAIRAALEAAGGFTFTDPPAANEETLAAVHDPAYIAYLREAAAELRRARGSSPRERWPTVFPFGPNPHARGERSLRGQYCTRPNWLVRARRSRSTSSPARPATTPSAIAAAATVTSTTPRSPPTGS